jgi:8-oxo-dGTP pyrophosphatase MutT (NUDIX family)
MAYFNKIGLLYLSDDQTKFLACEKDNFTSDFIMPGGRIEENENEIDCLAREIKEELDVDIDKPNLKFIGEYIDVAAGDPTKDVSIRLYEGKIIGEPKPSHEIKFFHWLSRNDLSNARLSPIIRNKILPDLIKRNILK